jgi:hypothetical protein
MSATPVVRGFRNDKFEESACVANMAFFFIKEKLKNQ